MFKELLFLLPSIIGLVGVSSSCDQIPSRLPGNDPSQLQEEILRPIDPTSLNSAYRTSIGGASSYFANLQDGHQSNEIKYYSEASLDRASIYIDYTGDTWLQETAYVTNSALDVEYHSYLYDAVLYYNCIYYYRINDYNYISIWVGINGEDTGLYFTGMCSYLVVSTAYDANLYFTYDLNDFIYFKTTSQFVSTASTINREQFFNNQYNLTYTEFALSNAFYTNSSNVKGNALFMHNAVFTFNLLNGSGDALNEAYQNGYNNGFALGQSTGYDTAYQNGYNDGVQYGVESFNLMDVFFAIGDIPIRMLYSMFNFDVLGVTLILGIFSLITLMLLAFIIRKLI